MCPKVHKKSRLGSAHPFVPLGINACDAASPSMKDGWCSPVSGIEATTSFDTSAMYMASGHLLSPDNNFIYLYSRSTLTHGGATSRQTWLRNTGIRVLMLRKDGFVSIDAPYSFYGTKNNALYPTFVTKNVRVPALKCLANESIAVLVNFVSSVAGFVVVGLEQNGVAVKGYGLNDGYRLKGNAVRTKVYWKGGEVGAFVGQEVAFVVAMADASLYALDVQCA